jgi:hypothetical protein
LFQSSENSLLNENELANLEEDGDLPVICHNRSKDGFKHLRRSETSSFTITFSAHGLTLRASLRRNTQLLMGKSLYKTERH